MEPERLLALAHGFLSFSLVASAVYIINDLVDLERDRRHPTKRHRPLAAGLLSMRTGVLMATGLLAGGLAWAFVWTGPLPFLVLVVYLLLNGLYSFKLKQIAVLDVVFLTLMYVIRLIVGGLVCDVAVSDWLLSFSLFFFLSIAFGKRCQELMVAFSDGSASIARVRGYRREDLPLLQISGIASALVSVLVLGLYIRSPEVLELYESPRLLWILGPILLYWLGRFWLITGRGEMNDDPILFAVRDPVSHLVLVLLGMTVLAARFGWIFTGVGSG
jgi:4-hydroxybenzoate polyprenyltransferase